MKITILGSSRQGYITNNYNCTNIHLQISYPHYTKEIIQVINFCKFGNLLPEETLYTFRTPILNKEPLYFNEILRNDFESSDLYILEISSKIAYEYNNIYIHHIATENEYNTSIKDKINIRYQDKNEIEDDISYIKNILKKQFIIVSNIFNDELNYWLEDICMRHGILFIDPIKEFHEKKYDINKLFNNDNYTIEGYNAIGNIYDYYINKSKDIKYTNNKLTDGFGSQYQKIIYSYVLCKSINRDFLYSPITTIEHNYNEDLDYIDKLENIINLKNNIPLYTNQYNVMVLDHMVCVREFENNVDIYSNNEHMNYIKNLFYENNINIYSTNEINIAVHIRRENEHDKGQSGERTTTKDEYYINVMNYIRKNYNNDKLLFHIYSQGNIKDFSCYNENNNDVKLHINEDIESTFIGLVYANILIMSPSSLSYSASLISNGIIIYKPYWSKPKKNWLIIT